MSFVRSAARIVFAATVCGACANLLDISPPGASSEGPADAGQAGAESGEGASSGVSSSSSGGEAGDAVSFAAGHGGARGGATGEGAAGVSGTGQGGAAGDASSAGGAGHGATDAGGASGASDGGTTTGGGAAGEGNAAGDGGAAGAEPEEWPVSGAPCSVPGKFACYMPASTLRYVCADGVWVQTHSCQDSDYFRCDRRTGTCAQMLCDKTGDFGCSGDAMMVCGPDLVTLSLEPCDFGCIPGETQSEDACAQQTVQQLLIDRPGGERFEDRRWPSPAIPVCFRDVASSAENEELREAIRHAVDTTWGRYDGVTFVGWNDCEETGDGVEIELLDDCEDTLAKVPRLGYPGDEAVLALGICRSYFDAKGDRHPRPGAPPDLELVGFVAEHVFGHVLGLDDLAYDQDSKQVMERALDLRDFENVELGWGELYQLKELYGPKPSGVWWSPSGRCLGARAGVLESAACDGTETATWELAPASMVHTATGECLVRDGEQVALATCTGVEEDEAFRLDRVRWRAPSNRCVAEIAPTAEQSPLVLTICDPSWPAAQRFGFEILGGDRVRIRTANGSCVRWPSDWTFPGIPEIGECDGVHDTFEARESRIEVSGRCLHSDLSELEFRACVDNPEQRFYVSGAFELGASALTLTGSVAAPELELTPLSFPPNEAQVFDYHF